MTGQLLPIASLSVERRTLMHAVMDGQFELAGAMHCLAQYKHCDTFLRWLVFNRITGKNLKSLLKDDLKGNVRELVKFIVQESTERTSDARRSP